MERLAIVQAWQQALDEGRAAGLLQPVVTAAFQRWLMDEQGRFVSRGTLYQWRRAWRRDGIAGLIDQRTNKRQRAAAPATEFLAAVRRWYLQPGGLHSIEVAFSLSEREAQEKGWPVCTLREAERFIRREVLPALTRERGCHGSTR